MYELYYLIDPRDNSIKYVGITKDAYIRFKCHCSDLRLNTPKTTWIRKLKGLNLKPILKIIKSNLSKEQAESLEISEIANTDGLLNSAKGGLINSGFKLSDQTKKIMASQRQGNNNAFFNKTHSEDTKRKIRAAVRKSIVDSNGVRYASLSEAANVLNIKVQNICAVLKGRRKCVKGLKFSYLEKS